MAFSALKKIFSGPYLGVTLTGTGASVVAYSLLNDDAVKVESHAINAVIEKGKVPSRDTMLQEAQTKKFDLLIIGGGATGAGIALDAATRGLSCCLIEQEDFGAGTSSRSTKLIHGGVRYLEKAVKNLDIEQLKLVFEALHERKTMIHMAPHLSRSLPIMTPCYQWWEVPYYWAGMKLYDLVAGTQALTWSRYVSAAESHRLFPTLSRQRREEAGVGDSLKGTIIYYDGQFDDARYNVALACTAAIAGATVLNHTRVTGLLTAPPPAPAPTSSFSFTRKKTDATAASAASSSGAAKDAEGIQEGEGPPSPPPPRVVGVEVADALTGERFRVEGTVVVNAAGPFSDTVRRMADPSLPPLIHPSSGVHVVLPDYYSPENCGLIVPKTRDGRVVFMLPWMDHTVAGTTDQPCALSMAPVATDDEVGFILEALRDYLTLEVRRSDVLAAWSGIRPLAVAHPGKRPSAASDATEAIVRDHVAGFEESGLLTITGGKWTTHRLMAQDAVDLALGSGKSPLAVREGAAGNVEKAPPCVTKRLRLIGAARYAPELFTEVAQHYKVPHRPGAIDTRVAKHLAGAYGDRAFEVTRLAEELALGKRLVRGHPLIEAEVIYCCRHELCETPEDFIARRSRLAFVDTRAAAEALPRVVDLMAKEKGWGRGKAEKELARARAFLKTFGGPDWETEHKQFRERKPVM